MSALDPSQPHGSATPRDGWGSRWQGPHVPAHARRRGLRGVGHPPCPVPGAAGPDGSRGRAPAGGTWGLWHAPPPMPAAGSTGWRACQGRVQPGSAPRHDARRRATPAPSPYRAAPLTVRPSGARSLPWLTRSSWKVCQRVPHVSRVAVGSGSVCVGAWSPGPGMVTRGPSPERPDARSRPAGGQLRGTPRAGCRTHAAPNQALEPTAPMVAFTHA